MTGHRYRVRVEPLPADTLLVVRGGLLEFGSLKADALAAAARFGAAGISVFGATDDAALDELPRQRLARFDVLTIATVRAIRTAGLDVLPTFRRPHYTILLPQLDDDLRRLLACENQIWPNNHHSNPR